MSLEVSLEMPGPTHDKGVCEEIRVKRQDRVPPLSLGHWEFELDELEKKNLFLYQTSLNWVLIFIEVGKDRQRGPEA